MNIDPMTLSPRGRLLLADALLALRRPSARTIAAAHATLNNNGRAGFQARNDVTRSAAQRRADKWLQAVAAKLQEVFTPPPAKQCECGSSTCLEKHAAWRCPNGATTQGATFSGDIIALCASCAAATAGAHR
jgi:hypothetical protein